MKAEKPKYTILLKSFLLLLIFITCPAFIAGSNNNLAGEKFSDPNKTQEMPEGWENQTIKHNKSFGETDLVIILNRQIYQALLPIIKQYEKENSLKIAVDKGTCGVSGGGISKKEIDLGVFCCPAGDTDRLPNLKFHTLGIMSIALLVNPENNIDDITLEQAREIFQGNIFRWSEIKDIKGTPGKNILIQPIGRLHCKKRPGHWRLLLDNSDLFSPDLQAVGAIPDMISLVASNPGAIGYEVMQMVREYQTKGKVKELKIGGLDPSDAQHLVSGDYPLYRTYNITTWEGENDKNPHAQKLVERLLAEIDHVDKKYGIIPASHLRQAGWEFKENELIGGPR